MWWIIGGIALTFLLVVLIIVLTINYGKSDKDKKETHKRNVDNRIIPITPRQELLGAWAEIFVNEHLRPILLSDEYLLENLLVPSYSNRKTEIDCVLITRRGIFCIETKRWIGKISGGDEDEYWIQKYPDPQMKDRLHRNPVSQNKGHCIALRKALKNKYPIDNIVIFVDIQDDSGIYSDYVFNVATFKRYYAELNDDEIPEEELGNIYQSLLPFVASRDELIAYRREAEIRNKSQTQMKN